MKRLYAAWCRSCGQANCDPRAIGVCLVIFAVAFGIGPAIARHESAIVHGIRIAAASILAVTAVMMLLWAMRMVMRATGQHHAPACAIPRRKTRTVPVPPAGTIPVPADVPAGYTWRIRPPEQEPVAEPVEEPAASPEPELLPWAAGGGKSDLITPHVADMTAMAAEAEALKHGDLDVLVSPAGTIFEKGKSEL